MASDPFNMPTYPLLIVISGPSGVGKDAVLERMKERQLPFHFVVTTTTRPIRPGEEHGVDYFFVSEDEFQRMTDKGELIEHARVYSDYKGIPKDQIRQAFESGEDVIMRVDVQGAATVRALAPQALLIFLSTPSEDQLIGRLKARKTETAEDLKLRIQTLRSEMQRIDQFDYMVVNADLRLDDTVDTILSIVNAEHNRTRHRQVAL